MCNNTSWSHNINCLQVAIMTPEGYPYIEISFQITHLAQKGRPHHQNLCPLLFMNSGVWSFQLSFTSHKNQIGESAVRWDSLQCMVFLSLSEKTGKYNPLQMSLQRWHFLLSSLIKDPVLIKGFESATSHSAD